MQASCSPRRSIPSLCYCKTLVILVPLACGRRDTIATRAVPLQPPRRLAVALLFWRQRRDSPEPATGHESRSHDLTYETYDCCPPAKVAEGPEEDRGEAPAGERGEGHLAE